MLEGSIVESIEQVERVYRNINEEIEELGRDYEAIVSDYYFVHVLSRSTSVNGIEFQKKRVKDTLLEKKEEAMEVYY